MFAFPNQAEIFQALTKTRLIENRETANYSRCGRTDKGVSAFGQVISIDLRSNLLEGSGVIQTIDGTAQERSGEVVVCEVIIILFVSSF